MAPLSLVFSILRGCLFGVLLHLTDAAATGAAFVVVAGRKQSRSHIIITNTALFSSLSPQRPPPRRALKKRKNKRRERIELAKNKDKINNNYIYGEGGGENDVVEIRPIRRRDAVEAGLDYWIDDSDFEREKQRRIAIKNRKAMEGSISKERLRQEVVAPYKQNWIGLISMVIVILATIVTNFPEAIEIPVIKIPDL